LSAGAVVGTPVTVNLGTWRGLAAAMYQGTGPNAARTYNGYNVMSIQGTLALAGIPTTIDGVYGPQTIANVRTYQARFGLTVDGLVGAQTWNHMVSFVTGPTTYTYAWASCPATVPVASATAPSGCTTIPSASSSSFTPTAAEVGAFLVAQVTATNSAGTTAFWTPSTIAIAP
jgi:peptidoglycan hydrolase-like protein with peptidoglycan-binding domain